MKFSITRQNFCLFFVLLSIAVLLPARSSLAEEAMRSDKPSFSMNFFKEKFSGTNIFNHKKKVKTIHIPNEEVQAKKKPQPQEKELSASDKTLRKKPFEVISRDRPGKLQSPHEKPQMRIEADAPSSVHVGMSAIATGDRETAQAAANQYVQYMTDVMFYVREWTSLVAKSLFEQEKIDDEEYYRAPDMLDQALAKSRSETGSLFTPTHRDAMKRITADPKGEVEVLYFFSLDCRYCRTMAPDVERLWQATRGDKKVKMAAMTMGTTPKSWLMSYRDHTGMTLPVFEGEKLARELQIAFVPALVVITKNGDKPQAYVKSGEQSFANMYEFVRTTQGLETKMSPSVAKLSKLKIGKGEPKDSMKESEISYREPKKVLIKQRASGKEKLSRF